MTAIKLYSGSTYVDLQGQIGVDVTDFKKVSILKTKHYTSTGGSGSFYALVVTQDNNSGEGW